MKKLVFLIVFCSLLFFVSGCSVKKTEDLSDAEKFANEYSVSQDNPFQYADIDDVLELFDGQSGILFLGNSDCEWSAYGAKVLNNVLREKHVSRVYYFNPDTIQQKKDKKYTEVLELLNFDEEASLPIVYVIGNGEIVDRVDYLVHKDSTINQETTKQLESKYLDLISQYI